MKTLQESILGNTSDIVQGVNDETDIVKALGIFMHKEYYDCFNGRLLYSLTSWYRMKDKLDDDELYELCDEEANWNSFNRETLETPIFNKWMIEKIFLTIAKECHCYRIDFGPGQNHDESDIDKLYMFTKNHDELADYYTYTKTDKEEINHVAKWLGDPDVKKATYLKIRNYEEFGDDAVLIIYSKSKPNPIMDGIFANIFEDGEANKNLRNKVRSRA